MKPYTDEEIKIMWDKEMEKRKDASSSFKIIFSWMFNFEEFKKVMKLAHLPNPYIQLVKKK